MGVDYGYFSQQLLFRMTPEVIIHIGQQALFHLTVLLLVMLVPALCVGVMISMFQAATQINEMTLSFKSKF